MNSQETALLGLLGISLCLYALLIKREKRRERRIKLKRKLRARRRLLEMSRTIRRKHILEENRQDDYAPPTGNQQIVRVLRYRGNYLHQVEAADKSVFFASIPTKFRKNVWVRRGDFIVVQPIEEGDKVKAEMIRSLTQDHIKYYKKENVWPQEFKVETERESVQGDISVNSDNLGLSESESSDSDCDDLEANDSDSSEASLE